MFGWLRKNKEEKELNKTRKELVNVIDKNISSTLENIEEVCTILKDFKKYN